jgi:hypothetical protein
MPGLAERRRTSIVAKIASLREELDDWKKLTEDAGSGMGRHNTQVRRLDAALSSMLEPLGQEVGQPAPDSSGILAAAEGWEKEILAAHSIWEVFRSKLVVRQNATFAVPLAACDDLAWSCYEPAMKQFAPGTKGPPLVFLSTTWSPFAQSRDVNFLNDIRASPGTTSALTDEAFQQVLNSLPIPLLGLPWYQTSHMPGALLAAHEVGHLVESDFGLTDDIVNAIRRAAPNNSDVWLGWASEMFADVYGCLAMGPYFVGALIDFLAASITLIQAEDRKSGKYPSRWLRLEIALQVLTDTGQGSEVARLRAAWESVYGEMLRMTDFVADARKVATALCAGPYRGRGNAPGVALTDVVRFSQPAATVSKVAKVASSGNAANLEGYVEPSLLFAAAQWLNENPQPRQKAEAYSLLLTQAARKHATQVRDLRGLDARTAMAERRTREEERIRQETADRQIGVSLRALLKTAADPLPAAERQGPPGS